MRRLCRSTFGLLTLSMLAACSLETFPLASSAIPTTPSEAVALPLATIKLRPTGAAPSPAPLRVTDVPASPTILVATFSPTMTTLLDEQQRLFVELYRRVSPAVVSIDVSGQQSDDPERATPDTDIPFAQGSGFVYDTQGHVITNNHVVEDASSFQVNFADGSVSEAQLVGTDPGSDLAVLKVDDMPLDTAPLALADSGQLAVGQTTIAIGNPFGLQNTLTVGVVSGLGRSLTGPQSEQGDFFNIPNVIQTDAAINPGNSGGPLLNTRGEVIGINTAIRTDTGAFQGIGYAVPSNAIRRVIPVLIHSGHYDHPWLGVAMRDVTPLIARHFKLAVRQGALITNVQDGSPADQADLRAGQHSSQYGGVTFPYDGDIIIAVNGHQVRSGDELVSYLEMEASVGDVVTLTLLREGVEQRITVLLGKRPDN